MSQHQLSSFARCFSETLRRARGGRSQADFARELGIKHQQTYQAYEAGRVPDGEMLQQISTKLGVTIDELLNGAKKKVPAVLKTDQEELTIPWGFELEENTQFTVAVGEIAQRMSSSQLLKASQGIVNNPVLNERSKLFWMKVLGNWAVKQAQTEEFNQLTPLEKLARIEKRKPMQQPMTEVPILTSDVQIEADSRLASFDPEFSSASAKESEKIVELADRKALKQFFFNLRNEDGLFPLDPSQVLSAVEIGVPVEQICLKALAGEDGKPSDLPQISPLTQVETKFLLQWKAYFQALCRGENPVKPNSASSAVGRIPVPSQSSKPVS